MSTLNLGEWTITQASSGEPITFVDGTDVNFKIQQDGTVNAPRGELQEQDKRVATRNWAKGDNITVSELSGVSGQGADGGLNADMVDGSHASAFALSGHDHALGDLSNVNASGEGSGNGLNADMIDGKDASQLGGVESHNDLTDISAGDHHTKYSDSEAVNAVESHGTISTNISGDADTVDGKDASQLGATKIDSGSNGTSNDLSSLQIDESGGDYYLEKWDDDNDKGHIGPVSNIPNPQDAIVTWYQEGTGGGGTLHWSIWQL